MSKRILMGLLLTAGAAGAVDISSLIFYEFTHDATEGGTADGKFENTRANLTVTDKPADNLSCKLQIDAGRAGSDGDDQACEYFIKSACVDWKTGLGKWTFGVQPMNMYPVQEATFGCRFLSAPLMDIHKFSASADLGVGYAKVIGPVQASLMWTNGPGFKKAESDKYKKLSLQVFMGEPALNKKDGWNAGLVYSTEPVNADDGKSVLGIFSGWAGMGARLGFEFDTRTTTGATDVTEQIIGVYGNYRIPLALPMDAFLQMDMYDPDTDTDDDGSTDLIVGVKFNPAKGLVIAPNLKTTSFEDSGSEPLTFYRVNFEFRI